MATETAAGLVTKRCPCAGMPDIDYDTIGNLDKTVDLDMSASNVADVFPNATGVLRVTGRGTADTTSEP